MRLNYSHLYQQKEIKNGIINYGCCDLIGFYSSSFPLSLLGLIGFWDIRRIEFLLLLAKLYHTVIVNVPHSINILFSIHFFPEIQNISLEVLQNITLYTFFFLGWIITANLKLLYLPCYFCEFEEIRYIKYV